MPARGSRVGFWRAVATAWRPGTRGNVSFERGEWTAIFHQGEVFLSSEFSPRSLHTDVRDDTRVYWRRKHALSGSIIADDLLSVEIVKIISIIF
jgi:hypothetical protein